MNKHYLKELYDSYQSYLRGCSDGATSILQTIEKDTQKKKPNYADATVGASKKASKPPK